MRGRSIFRRVKLLGMIFLCAILYLVYFKNYTYDTSVISLIYKGGKWREEKLNINIKYNHNLILSDYINGYIYSDDDVLKYWKDYLRDGDSKKIGDWNVKELIYSPKNSYINGKYVYSGFIKEEFINIGNIYYKNFMKSIVIILRDHKFQRKDGINYFETQEYKPIIILAGNVNKNDLLDLSSIDYLLREFDVGTLPSFKLNEKVKMQGLKFDGIDFKKSIESNYKELAWRSVGSYVNYEDIKRVYGEPKHDNYILQKISELENFKSGFIDSVEMNEKMAHIDKNVILTEGIYKTENGSIYSAVIYKLYHNYNSYVVDNVYTIKMYDDGKQEFASDKFGILTYACE